MKKQNPFADMANGSCGYTEEESAAAAGWTRKSTFWRWIGWPEFWRYFWFGFNITLGAAIGVAIFYGLVYGILLLEPTQ